MKTLALLSALFISFTAQARTPIYDQTEILPKVTIDGQETGYTAVVNINFHTSKIKAEIFNDICNNLTAPVGVITCMAAPRLVTTIEAPITEKGTSCGSTIYKAFRDDAPRDGLRVDIHVADHSTRMCKDLVASAFEVKATVFNPWNQKATEYYLAK